MIALLKEWYKNNPSKALNGKRWAYKDNLEQLHSLQRDHHEGKINLYDSIEAYSVKWTHVIDRNTKEFVSASPIMETSRREDLPPVYIQWKDDYRSRQN